MFSIDPSVYDTAEIVVREITKGIHKIIKSKLFEVDEDTYLDNETLAKYLNTNKVLIVNNDSQIIHLNFNV